MTGSSAAKTAFCVAEIKGLGGSLWIDGNGKIARTNGTLDDPKPNALSLVEVQDCPGSTPSCRAACYVHGLKAAVPDVHDLYVKNSIFLHKLMNEADGTRLLWALELADWIGKNAPGGFRWHVSGDIFSKAYAEWIADVCSFSLDVPYWIYTRSFDLIDPLLEVSTLNGGNLAINLSCDADNYIRAMYAQERTGLPLRLCYLTRDGQVPADLPEGSVIFPDYGLRGSTEPGRVWFESLPQRQKSFVCPVDYHGKSEQRRCGPCARCLT